MATRNAIARLVAATGANLQEHLHDLEVVCNNKLGNAMFGHSLAPAVSGHMAAYVDAAYASVGKAAGANFGADQFAEVGGQRRNHSN